jgi:hypothetical protein
MMRVNVVTCAVVAGACGRIAFDPNAGTPATDAGPGTSPDGSRALGACASAPDVQVNVPINGNTCTGTNSIQGCAPANTPEVVYRFVAPETRGYQLQATGDHGIQLADSTCTIASVCAGIYASTFTQGETVYVVLELDVGGCDTFTLTITPSP